jgi:hypothetical protein
MTKPQTEATEMAYNYWLNSDPRESTEYGQFFSGDQIEDAYLAGFKAAVDFVEKEAIKAHHQDELKSKDFVGGMYEVYFRLQKLLGKES